MKGPRHTVSTRHTAHNYVNWENSTKIPTRRVRAGVTAVNTRSSRSKWTVAPPTTSESGRSGWHNLQRKTVLGSRDTCVSSNSSRPDLSSDTPLDYRRETRAGGVKCLNRQSSSHPPLPRFQVSCGHFEKAVHPCLGPVPSVDCQPSYHRRGSRGVSTDV